MKGKKKIRSLIRGLKKRKDTSKKQNSEITQSAKKVYFEDAFQGMMEQTVTFFTETPDAVLVGISSIIGAREYQQDAADVMVNTAGATLAIVCDGMGGMEEGGRASELCVKKMCEAFQNYTGSNYIQFLCEEINRLNREVAGFCDKDGKPVAAGTTVAAVIITKGTMFWSSVGDSRIYIIRNGTMVQVTKDHNYKLILKERVKSGEITQLEAEQTPRQEALISFIGLGHIERIDINQKPFLLEKGDYILLCSDGLYKAMNEELIRQTVLLYADDVSEAAEALTATAACMGGSRQDNTTVIIMKY